MQKTCSLPQEKFSDPEKILSAKKHGSNLDKKRLKFTKKKLGSNNFFGKNKANIDLTTTLSLIEV